MRRLLGLLVLSLLLVFGGSPLALGQPLGATVTVLHGLPAFTADVYLNGELTLDGFEPLDATDPFELPPGEHTIEIRDVGAAPDSEPVLEATASVESGTNVSVIPHLTAGGEPTIALFSNDLSPVAPGKGRFVARHVAGSSPLDFLVDGEPVATGLESGQEAATELAAGSHTLVVNAAGSSQELLGPLDFNLREGTAQAMFVVGSQDEQTLEVMTQTIPGLQSPPASVTTGDGGMADRETSRPMLAVMAVFGAGAIASAMILLGGRRRRSHEG